MTGEMETIASSDMAELLLGSPAPLSARSSEDQSASRRVSLDGRGVLSRCVPSALATSLLPAVQESVSKSW